MPKFTLVRDNIVHLLINNTIVLNIFFLVPGPRNREPTSSRDANERSERQIFLQHLWIPLRREEHNIATHKNIFKIFLNKMQCLTSKFVLLVSSYSQCTGKLAKKNVSVAIRAISLVQCHRNDLML